jgi:hypothetical protein
MSVKTLLKPTCIVNLNNIVPNTQPSGNWSGNGTQLTTLDTGLYLATLTVNFQIGSGVGNLSNCLCSIYTNAASPNRFLGMPTSAFGCTGTVLPKQSMANIVYIPQDNTGIYLFLSCNLTGTWGLTDIVDPSLNQLVFIRIDQKSISPITIPVKIFNQITASWTGNGIPISYLNSGIYYCVYNTTTKPINSGGNITATQYVLTKNTAYPTGELLLGTELISYGISGTGSNIVGQTMANIIFIENNNTPIYLTINVAYDSPTIVWGIQTLNTVWQLYYDVLYFVRLN